MQSISVRHNIEVAHRLYTTHGKCENIHGHSMWVTLTLEGNIDRRTGMLANLDFSGVKKSFRSYLDENYDHRLLLNMADPFAQAVQTQDDFIAGETENRLKGQLSLLPGLNAVPGDPTTENIALWVGETFRNKFNLMETGVSTVGVEVWETSVNKANWRSDW